MQLKHFLKVTNTPAFVNLYEKGIAAAKKAKIKKEVQKKETQKLSRKLSPDQLSPHAACQSLLTAALPLWQPK